MSRLLRHIPLPRSSRLIVVPRASSLALQTRSISFQRPGPSPPRLPEEEQAEFERLQKQSTGAFSTPREEPTTSGPARGPSEPPAGATQPKPELELDPTSSSSSPSSSSTSSRSPPRVNQASDAPANTSQPNVDARIPTGDGEELHPDIRRGAKPEFEGDTNPKTGEVGGPKNEPLRWGHTGDWSYNGRVTDF